MHLRTALLIAAGTVTASAAAGPSCDALDQGQRVELRDTDIDLDGRDLVLRASGAELQQRIPAFPAFLSPVQTAL